MVKIFANHNVLLYFICQEKEKWCWRTVTASILTPKTVSLLITACKVLSYCAKIMIITNFTTNSPVFSRLFLALYWIIIRIIQAQRAILCSQIWDHRKFYAMVTFVILSYSVCLFYRMHPKFENAPGQSSYKWE